MLELNVATGLPDRDVSVSEVRFDRPVLPKRRFLDGWFEVVSNVIGTFLFVVGSFMWVVSEPFTGTIIFASACVFCGASCSIYAHKFRKTTDFAECFALVCQAIGCFLFTFSSVLFLFPHPLALSTMALQGFLTASILFLVGCSLTQIMIGSWFGSLAGLWIKIPPNGILPTALLNTVGSIFFTIGSSCLFFPSMTMQLQGAWWYAIGSILFFFASWGDFVLWFDARKHPTEGDDAYAMIKFDM